MGQFSVEICHLVGQFSMKLNNHWHCPVAQPARGLTSDFHGLLTRMGALPLLIRLYANYRLPNATFAVPGAER